MVFVEGDEFYRAHSGSKGGKASNNAGALTDLALLSEAPVSIQKRQWSAYASRHVTISHGSQGFRCGRLVLVLTSALPFVVVVVFGDSVGNGCGCRCISPAAGGGRNLGCAGKKERGATAHA